jgi:LAO/AO transport system kinase
MLHLRPPSPWAIPVLPTTASSGAGVDEVVAALERHREFVGDDAARAERAAGRRADELLDILDEEMRRRLEAWLLAERDGSGALVASVRRGEIDPYSAALRVLHDRDALAALIREPVP